VRPHPFGVKTGIDLDRMNQLAGELEAVDAAQKLRSDSEQHPSGRAHLGDNAKQRAELHSTNADFARFRGLRWVKSFGMSS
jgi:hypothetical protein